LAGLTSTAALRESSSQIPKKNKSSDL
jgi:hypothetical protein